MRWVTSAWNRTTSPAAAVASRTMPFEKTSRCPRLVSCLGMKWSSAWKLASRGKSAKLVLAANTRMSIVVACTSRNAACPAAPLPKTPDAICEMTVFLSLGTTCIFIASHEIPMNITPRHAPMTISVARAFLHSGFLNAGTPLDRLDPCHRRAARRERVEQEEDAHRARHTHRDVVRRDRGVREPAGRGLEHTHTDHHEDADEER